MGLCLSFPAQGRAIVGSRMVPAILLPNASLLGIPVASRRARRHGQPHPPRAQFGLGLRGGAATPASTPAPAPYVGARRAPRPWWPRYCFTFPGVCFPLSGKKRDGGRRAPRLRFPLPGHARWAPDRPEEGLGPTPERSRRPARRRPSSRPPGAPLRPLPPGPASPSLPYAHLPAALSLYAPVRLPVGRPGRTPLGTRRLLPVLRLRHQPPRGHAQAPPPPAGAAAPAGRARGAGAAWARGTAPGPAPSRRPGRASGLGGLAGTWRWGGGVVGGAPEAAPAGGEGHPRTWTHLACGPAAPKVNRGFTGSLPGALPKAQRRPQASRRATQKQSLRRGRGPPHIVQPILRFALAPNFLEVETELDSEIAWVLTLVPPLPQDKPWSGLRTSVSPSAMVM